jgi:hypothetical protein
MSYRDLEIWRLAREVSISIYLHEKLTMLGKKLHCFLQAVETQHQSVREDMATYTTGNEVDRE